MALPWRRNGDEIVPSRGILLMIASALLFSIMGALVKAMTAELPFIEVVFFRSFISVLLLIPLLIRKNVPFIGRAKRQLLLRGFFGFIALALNFYCTSRLKLADAALLNLTSTLFVALLSAVFLKERLTPALSAYILSAFLGSLLIIKPRFDVVNLPGLLGLVSGFSAALAYITIKKLHATESFYTIVFSFTLFSTVASFLPMLRNFETPDPMQAAALLGIGAFGMIAQLCMTAAYKNMDASVVNPYSFTGVLFSALWGAMFWGEIPDLMSWIGGIVLIACLLRIVQTRKEPTGEAQAAAE